MACFLGLGMTQKVKMRFFVSGEVCQRAVAGWRSGRRTGSESAARSEAWRWLVFLDLGTWGAGDAEIEDAIFRERERRVLDDNDSAVACSLTEV